MSFANRVEFLQRSMIVDYRPIHEVWALTTCCRLYGNCFSTSDTVEANPRMDIQPLCRNMCTSHFRNHSLLATTPRWRIILAFRPTFRKFSWTTTDCLAPKHSLMHIALGPPIAYWEITSLGLALAGSTLDPTPSQGRSSRDL